MSDEKRERARERAIKKGWLAAPEDQCPATAETAFDRLDARCIAPAGHQGDHYDGDLRYRWREAVAVS